MHSHINTLVFTFTYAYNYVQTCAFARMNICMHARIHSSPTCTYTKAHTFTHKCIPIYRPTFSTNLIYAYTDIYILTQINKDNYSFKPIDITS